MQPKLYSVDRVFQIRPEGGGSLQVYDFYIAVYGKVDLIINYSFRIENVALVLMWLTADKGKNDNAFFCRLIHNNDHGSGGCDISVFNVSF